MTQGNRDVLDFSGNTRPGTGGSLPPRPSIFETHPPAGYQPPWLRALTPEPPPGNVFARFIRWFAE